MGDLPIAATTPSIPKSWSADRPQISGGLMFWRAFRRSALGLLLLASGILGGAAQAAPLGGLPNNNAPNDPVTISFYTTFFGWKGETSEPGDRIEVMGALTVTAEAFRKGFDFRFENSGAWTDQQGNPHKGLGYLDQTDGLLDLSVILTNLDRPGWFPSMGVDLAYLRAAQHPIGISDSKSFSLQGGIGRGLSGTFRFDDANYPGYNGFPPGEFGVAFAFDRDDFTGRTAGTGFGCFNQPCFFAGEISVPRVPVPAPGALALLALGVLGVGMVRRRQPA
ncbi:PEP-CTERM sorting domain-containing protein [Sabulicella glaciei]|uniref:PEP-CTERM sorting domain-containing protein n=1 Tax=Sabulicella glaciei TaxID=2984948 RepID=A0ABT3NYS5_9PROT|nr:PEP-CTERM sorting domain-containing protein [Roseococcus sp. MDT2-1-1]MCW8087319.1 PEP-CTERM sorting domain-containing protein [Roseococcus sp. MDT2-1-1]